MKESAGWVGGWVGGRTGCLGRRKGKCGSTQSKPDHMFRSAGISPLALTGELCKRLLICESRVEKLGVGGGWLGGLRPLTGPSVELFFFFGLVCHWKQPGLSYSWRC